MDFNYPTTQELGAILVITITIATARYLRYDAVGGPTYIDITLSILLAFIVTTTLLVTTKHLDLYPGAG